MRGWRIVRRVGHLVERPWVGAARRVRCDRAARGLWGRCVGPVHRLAERGDTSVDGCTHRRAAATSSIAKRSTFAYFVRYLRSDRTFGGVDKVATQARRAKAMVGRLGWRLRLLGWLGCVALGAAGKKPSCSATSHVDERVVWGCCWLGWLGGLYDRLGSLDHSGLLGVLDRPLALPRLPEQTNAPTKARCAQDTDRSQSQE